MASRTLAFPLVSSREYERIKYYVGIPEDGYLDTEFIVVHPDLKEELLKRLSKEYYDPYTDYSLREGIILNLIYGQVSVMTSLRLRLLRE